jgi:hypothetical protein
MPLIPRRQQYRTTQAAELDQRKPNFLVVFSEKCRKFADFTACVADNAVGFSEAAVATDVEGLTDPKDSATGQISPDSETLTAGLTGEAFIQS